MLVQDPHGELESQQVREKADALHAEALVILAHDHRMSRANFRQDRRGGVTAKVVMAIVDARMYETRELYERSFYSTEGFMRDAMVAYDRLLRTAEESPEEVLVVKLAGDIREAKRSGRLGLILGSEGAKHLEGTLAALRNFYRLGVRQVHLHWAVRNQLGTAQSDPDEPGLTEFGREVVAEMNRLGMVIDVSHSSPATIADVLAVTTRPIVNGHTGARTINPASPQLLWDDQIRALADNGGVAAVHFNTSVLIGRSQGRRATVDDVIAHIDHLVDVGGVDCVGLGPDFIPKGERLDQRVKFNQRIPDEAWVWTKDLDDSSKLRNLTRALVARGYPEAHVSKILGGNLMRVLESTMG